MSDAWPRLEFENMGGGGGRARRTSNNNINKKSKSRWRSNLFSSSYVQFKDPSFVECEVSPINSLKDSLRVRSQNPNSKSGSKDHKINKANCAAQRFSRTDFLYSNPSGYLQESNVGENDLNKSENHVLVDSKSTCIVACLDEGPSFNPITVDHSYNSSQDNSFDDDLYSHFGLGGECKHATPDGIGSPSVKIEENADVSFIHSSPWEKEMTTGDVGDGEAGYEATEEMNSAFLSFGGIKLFTEDLSDAGSDHDNEKSVDGGCYELSDECSSRSGSNLDIDEDVAEDYIEGIGGSFDVVSAKWMEKGCSSDTEEESYLSDDCFDETLEGLSGISLQNASSREYRMKQRWLRKGFLDDLVLEEVPSTIFCKKKHAIHLSRSAPADSHKYAKKKHRKKMTAAKCRRRMLGRGVDLKKINLILEQIVKNNVDMFSFEPMHSRDCCQVQRLASLYGLHSMSQGAGKKRFVTLTRTRRTCMPSPSDRLRMIKLTRDGEEEISEHARIGISEGKPRRKEQTKRKFLVQPICPERGPSKKHGEKKKSRTASHSLPVRFVSGSAMQCDAITVTNVGLAGGSCGEQGTVGAFEAHTKGFGSRMMAKMGFVGGGLGKDGQGITGPLEVIQRPKSLGLGAFLPPRNSGDFEKNPKPPDVGEVDSRTGGFRSKMVKIYKPVGVGLAPQVQSRPGHWVST